MSASPFSPQPPPIPVAWGRPAPERPVSPVRPVTPLAACVRHFAATPSAPGWARRHTADVLERWDVPDLVWSANQVVSELVTNAVLHGGAGLDGPPPPCRLTLKLFPDDLLAVEVWDPATGQPLRAGCPDALAESGRGLAIVELLSVAPPLVFGGPGVGKTIVALLARPR